MQHKEFALHRAAKLYDIPDILQIGWLDDRHDFRTGAVPPKFMQKLQTLMRMPIKAPDHGLSCRLCSQSGTLHQCLEYWLRNHDGKIFVAPGLIYHHINQHQYCPPEPYIDAVLRIGAFFKKSQIMSPKDVADFIRPFAKKHSLRIGKGLGV
ncbi:MAG: hypothetical protein ACOCXJ_01925 [Planctomycetota bacterium]